MCWRKSYRFWRSTQLSRLVDTYLETLVEQKGVKKITDLKEEEQILHEVYTHSPDMQMLLNLLTEKEGIWSSILILSTFDRNFKNEFKVLSTVVSKKEHKMSFLDLKRQFSGGQESKFS